MTSGISSFGFCIGQDSRVVHAHHQSGCSPFKDVWTVVPLKNEGLLLKMFFRLFLDEIWEDVVPLIFWSPPHATNGAPSNLGLCQEAYLGSLAGPQRVGKGPARSSQWGASFVAASAVSRENLARVSAIAPAASICNSMSQLGSQSYCLDVAHCYCGQQCLLSTKVSHVFCSIQGDYECPCGHLWRCRPFGQIVQIDAKRLDVLYPQCYKLEVGWV